MKSVKDMTREELESAVEYALGLWHESYSKKLPWVYCPVCGAKMKKPSKKHKDYGYDENKNNS